MSDGARQIGLEIIAAFDHWAPAIDTYKANFSHPVLQADLGQVGQIVPQVLALSPDVIVGGPPCQDFSHAGIRAEGERAELTGAFAETVVGVRPRAFVMENVPAALKSATYSRARKLFKAHGYGLTEATVDASYLGVPQRRKRVFVIGILGANDEELLAPIKHASTLFPLSVRRGVPELQLEHYYRHPRSYTRRAVFSVDEPSPTIRGTNRPRPSSYEIHSGDASASKEVRALTSGERARVQSFASGFQWVGSQTEIDQMVGNAVPPKLAATVLTVLTDFIKAGDGGGARSLHPADCTCDSADVALLRRIERKYPINHFEEVPEYFERVLSLDIPSARSRKTRQRLASVLANFPE